MVKDHGFPFLKWCDTSQLVQRFGCQSSVKLPGKFDGVVVVVGVVGVLGVVVVGGKQFLIDIIVLGKGKKPGKNMVFDHTPLTPPPLKHIYWSHYCKCLKEKKFLQEMEHITLYMTIRVKQCLQMPNLWKLLIVYAPLRIPHASPRKVNAPLRKVNAPLGKVNAPLRKVNAPLRKVNAPLRKVNAPLRKVNAPLGEVNAPLRKVNAPLRKVNVLCSEK